MEGPKGGRKNEKPTDGAQKKRKNEEEYKREKVGKKTRRNKLVCKKRILSMDGRKSIGRKEKGKDWKDRNDGNKNKERMLR